MQLFILGVSIGAIGGFFSSWCTLKYYFNRNMKAYTEELSKQYNKALTELKDGHK